jgi:dihydroorotate dehydrogenase electron transfer subunit
MRPDAGYDGLMTSHLSAAFYADRASYQRVEVLENERIARDTYRLRFAFPQLARTIVPGQFAMVRLADCDDPLLARPLALYDTALGGDGGNEPASIDVVYLVVGKMTGRLAAMVPGQQLEVWGPLGNGFAPCECEHLLMVAGGIGQTPFLAMAREALGQRQYGDRPRIFRSRPRVTLCYGVRSQPYLAGVADFEKLGVEVRISTDDGSAGHRGLVTDLVERALDESPGAHVVCCGPEPMMEAVSKIALARGVGCQVSLETPMACGIGICFSCVARVRDANGQWDYRRTCVEGPVFDAAAIEW